MNAEHWILLGITGALLGLLLWFSLTALREGRVYHLARRLFWSAALLWMSGMAGGVGLNGLTLLTAAALGLPGYAALTVLSRL